MVCSYLVSLVDDIFYIHSRNKRVCAGKNHSQVSNREIFSECVHLHTVNFFCSFVHSESSIDFVYWHNVKEVKPSISECKTG
mmetsp:Transcript_18622/g.24323  ORF Transcript_18622/g.24323 Transcript_18622/m.24323 type:complete len:82 (+) Transcript_18622:747-992(+)